MRLFSQTSTAGPHLTTDETSILGTGVGSLIIPANSLCVGDTFRITIGAMFKNPSQSGGAFMLLVNLGGCTLIGGNIQYGSCNNENSFTVSIIATVRSLGVSGSMYSTFGATMSGIRNDSGEFAEAGGLGTLDTTIENLITASVILEDAANSFNCGNFVVERLGR